MRAPNLTGVGVQVVDLVGMYPIRPLGKKYDMSMRCKVVLHADRRDSAQTKKSRPKGGQVRNRAMAKRRLHFAIHFHGWVGVAFALPSFNPDRCADGGMTHRARRFCTSL